MPVWGSELIPKLVATPELNATALLDYLQKTYPGCYADSVLRTLQRRVKEWKALHGPERTVIFTQVHEPGRQGLSDFTHLKDITITIQGKALKHRWYHFRLAMSGWSYLQVTLGGESYSALAAGLQNALWRLGGSPKEHRTDHLSACFKNLSKESQQDVTTRYEALCAHYQMAPTRNNLGASHENGSIESPHGHVKRAVKQALLLRGSHDYQSIEAYQAWLDGVIKNYNERHAQQIAHERDFLQPLPLVKTADYTELVVRVKRTSSITIRCVTYTVPSRLCGERLRVHLHDDRLECYLGNKHTVTLTRVYPPKGSKRRARSINYRHVISSLVKKTSSLSV